MAPCSKILGLCAVLWMKPAQSATVYGSVSTFRDPCTEEGVMEAAPTTLANHEAFREVLSGRVVQGTLAGIPSTLFDYDNLRQDDSSLIDYLKLLCNVNVESMEPKAQLAFWLNTYNAFMIHVIVQLHPDESVRQLHEVVPGNSIWDWKCCTVAGEKVSLGDVEHKKIRGELADSLRVSGRVHAGMNCASLSCPDLQPLPFEADTVEEMLTTGTRSWMANPGKNPGPQRAEGGVFVLNQIFNWFPEDFVKADGSAQNFAKKYGPATWQPVFDAIEADSGKTPLKLPVVFADYSWALNAVDGTGEVTPSFARRQSSLSASAAVALLAAGLAAHLRV